GIHAEHHRAPLREEDAVAAFPAAEVERVVARPYEPGDLEREVRWSSAEHVALGSARILSRPGTPGRLRPLRCARHQLPLARKPGASGGAGADRSQGAKNACFPCR